MSTLGGAGGGPGVNGSRSCKRLLNLYQNVKWSYYLKLKKQETAKETFFRDIEVNPRRNNLKN